MILLNFRMLRAGVDRQTTELYRHQRQRHTSHGTTVRTRMRTNHVPSFQFWVSFVFVFLELLSTNDFISNPSLFYLLASGKVKRPTNGQEWDSHPGPHLGIMKNIKAIETMVLRKALQTREQVNAWTL